MHPIFHIKSGFQMVTEITSRQANDKMVKSGKKISHAEIIRKSMERFKRGTYPQIAGFCGLTPQQVEKRLSEMERSGTIRKTKQTGFTSPGSKGIVWEIIQDVDQPTTNPQTTLFN